MWSRVHLVGSETSRGSRVQFQGYYLWTVPTVILWAPSWTAEDTLACLVAFSKNGPGPGATEVQEAPMRDPCPSSAPLLENLRASWGS